jgi:hypothetical protein
VTSQIFSLMPHGSFALPIIPCSKPPQAQLFLDGTCCLTCPS